MKTHFSELVRLVERGETITITRGYAPVALLIRIGATPQARRQGTLHTTLKLDPALWDDDNDPPPPATAPTTAPDTSPPAPDRATSLA